MTPPLPPHSRADPYDAEAFRASGRALVDLLADHLAAMNAGGAGEAVLPASDPEALVEAFAGRFGGGADPGALFAEMLERSHKLHHPRYMGHQVCCPWSIAALADFFCSTLNNGTAIYEMGPVGLAAERACVRWMAGRLGYGEGSDGVFVSGGSLGNLTALLAARQANAGFDAWADGALGPGGDGPPLAVLVSEQSHYCVARAAQVMGLGAGGVVTVETDERFRVTADALEAAHARAEAAGRRVIAAVASCCTTPTGAYDPLPVLADFAQRRGLWLHVDGAHGASAAASDNLRDRVAGIERADSVVWDAHKLLGAPSLSTAVLFRDGRRSHEAFAQEASYLLDDTVQENWWDGARRTLECTRRTLALPLYVALAHHGEAALAAHVERLHALADAFASIIREAGDFELAVEPESNIVCFRHTPEGAGADDLDAIQTRAREAIVKSGAFFLVRTMLRGRVWLRTTLMNPRTTEDDLRALLPEVRRVSAPARAGVRGV